MNEAKVFRVELYHRRVGIDPEQARLSEIRPEMFKTYKDARAFIVFHLQSYTFHGFNEERGYWWGRARDSDEAHLFTIRYPVS